MCHAYCGRCPRSMWGPIYGHDQHGHRLARLLYSQGFRSYAQVRAVSDKELQQVGQLGQASLVRIRSYCDGVGS